MDIHEYQAKKLLSGFGVNVPEGALADSPEQAVREAESIGAGPWVVKAQVHSGARGKAGGIKFCQDKHAVRCAADELLGSRLVTHQTGPDGKPVHRLYVEAAQQIEHEYYLSVVMDRSHERVIVIASADGGMEIEAISEGNPDSIIRCIVDPAVGMQAFQARKVACGLGLPANLIGQATQTILGVYRAFRDLDATMVEINPMVLTKSGELLVLDAKASFDDNALFRRPNISELRDKSQEDIRETQANDHGLNYVGLEGEIGCIINGAGLAMATMDMIQLAGGEPANFLDIGGGASPERVLTAFRLVLSDQRVKAILINIFAGINRCDWVAEGVVRAVRELEPEVPVVVRLSGTNVVEGKAIIANCGLAIITADDLASASRLIVEAWKNG